MPRWGTKYDGFHGPLKAMNYVDVGHSLEGLGNLIYPSWCDYFPPNMIHIFQEFKGDGVASKCWGGHLTLSIPWQ